MTKRYYYDDPIAAAWMAKHFGMRFISERGNEWPLVDILHFASDLNAIWMEKFYIHPESEHILEPMPHDVTVNGWHARYVLDDCNAVSYGFLKQSLAKQTVALGTSKIIQRNGIPFIWPKEEAIDAWNTRADK